MRDHDRVAVQDNKLRSEEQYKQSASDVILLPVLHMAILPPSSLIRSMLHVANLNWLSFYWLKSLGLLAVALNYSRCHAGRKWEYTQHLKKGRNELM